MNDEPLYELKDIVHISDNIRKEGWGFKAEWGPFQIERILAKDALRHHHKYYGKFLNHPGRQFPGSGFPFIYERNIEGLMIQPDVIPENELGLWE